MSILLKKNQQRSKRRRRIRARVFGTAKRPRLSVFRSNSHIYAQVIDDQKGVTLVSVNDKEITVNFKDKKDSKSESKVLSKKDMAFEVGVMLAAKAAKKKIKKIVFDRGGYRYHGRVTFLAEGARKGGLEF
jgi:large subunit ribosomal protein L18